MIVVMKTDTPISEVQRIIQELPSESITTETIVGKHKVIIGLVGDTATLNPQQIQWVTA